MQRVTAIFGAMAILALLPACARLGITPAATNPDLPDTPATQTEERQSTIWDIFRDRSDDEEIGAVNRYLWNASLQTLDFLPIETVDPFTGIIVTGFGTPPGGGTAYRATVLIDDPALDARSLNLTLQTRRGPVSQETLRAVEDAILTRARQLRVSDAQF